MRTFVNVNVHSVVDLITNSSTEIFMSASDSAIQNVKEIIDAVLKASGSDKTCDDLFIVEKAVMNESSILSYAVDYIIDDPESWEHVSSRLSSAALSPSVNYGDKMDLVHKELEMLMDNGELTLEQLVEGRGDWLRVEYSVRIKTKDDETDLGLAERIFNLFVAEEREC